MEPLNFWENLIQEEVLADQIQQQGYTYPQALGMIKRYGVNQISSMVGGILDHDMTQHFNQQVLVEKWSTDRGINNISVPDFADHLCNQYGFLSDLNEIDSAYAQWSR